MPEKVIIQGREFTVSGDNSELIQQAAALVNQKINEVGDQSNSVSSLNLALLSAMNIAHSYLELKERSKSMAKRSEQLLQMVEQMQQTQKKKK